MMKKISAIIAISLLCVSALTGCQETPEEVLVKPKEQNEQSYEEATSEEKIAERLGIESTYSASFQTADGKTDFTADHVEVEYPDVNHIPVYQVSLRKFDQDFIDQITKALFGDAPVYFRLDYETRSKSEIMEEIEYMKECIAKGELDPYDLEHGEDAGKHFDIYTYIEELEEEYKNAPEEYTHKTVTPSIDFDPEANGYEIPEEWKEYYEDDIFDGYAVVDEDHVYFYEIMDYEKYGGEKTIKAVRNRFKDTGSKDVGWSSCFSEILSTPESEWFNSTLSKYGIEESELEEKAGISQEDALKQADALVEKMGIEGMTVNYSRPAVMTIGVPDGSEECGDVGYEFQYTRTLDGISTLYTVMDNTTSMEDSTVSSIRYEAISIIVSEEGIEQVELRNINEIGEIKQNNPVLLSYEEILEKYEDMMLIQCAQIPDDEDYTRHIVVEQVVLSYMRLTEAGTGNYLLVPVWDFLGKDWDTDYSVGYIGANGEFQEACGMVWSPLPLLTINAMDGSVIDRTMGY